MLLDGNILGSVAIKGALNLNRGINASQGVLKLFLSGRVVEAQAVLFAVNHFLNPVPVTSLFNTHNHHPF